MSVLTLLFDKYYLCSDMMKASFSRCGIPIDPSAEEKRKKRSDRIFGGEEASLEYPWMVRVYYMHYTST